MVRTQLIRVLAQQARESRATSLAPAALIAAAEPVAPALRYTPSDVVAFVDLQNLHYFLKENCRVAATQVHIPDLLRAFGAQHGMPLRDIQIFTGIRDLSSWCAASLGQSADVVPRRCRKIRKQQAAPSLKSNGRDGACKHSTGDFA